MLRCIQWIEVKYILYLGNHKAYLCRQTAVQSQIHAVSLSVKHQLTFLQNYLLSLRPRPPSTPSLTSQKLKEQHRSQLTNKHHLQMYALLSKPRSSPNLRCLDLQLMHPVCSLLTSRHGHQAQPWLQKAVLSILLTRTPPLGTCVTPETLPCSLVPLTCCLYKQTFWNEALSVFGP